MKVPTRIIRISLAAVLCATAFTLWSSEVSAQRRGRPVRGRASTVIVAPPVYFGYGYYDPFWWGYPGWYPYGWYPPLYGPSVYDANVGSARLQVKPRNADVYVDGYLAGTVDDFDGFMQRLDVPAGEHELTVYLEGYRTVTQKVLFRPGATLRIKYELQPLAPGEATEQRPQAPAQEIRPPGGRPATQLPDQQRPSSAFGTLAIRVQPSDARLLVDGEEWTAPDGAGPVRIELGEGPHEIEVRKEGFITFRRTVRVRSGETVSLNVSLSR